MPAVPKPKYRRRVPKQRKRGKFSDETIGIIRERSGGICEWCQSAPPDEIPHHIRYKSQGGRNGYTNGIDLCRKCHDEAHARKSVRRAMEQWAIDRYGENYYKDEWDV